jgi:hypothetical protein
MTGREAALFTRLVEDVVRPGGVLPPVRQTDAVAAFDVWLRAAPRLNRLLMRGVLRSEGRPAALGDVLRRIAAHCYFGDAEVMRRLGYDAEAVVRSATSLRLAEGRP